MFEHIFRDAMNEIIDSTDASEREKLVKLAKSSSEVVSVLKEINIFVNSYLRDNDAMEKIREIGHDIKGTLY